MSKPLVKKVLLIGWDAADWKVIEPLMEQGKMPALQGLMARGSYGRIQTLDPPLSPMLWTSIATGFRADTHGIGGFIEPIPDGTGLRPVTSTSRKVKAIWNILNQNGKKSNVVAWWPSNPAEPINGVMVSNLYQMASKPLDEEWPMIKGTIHPSSMEEEMKEWRVHPAEMTVDMVYPFIPNINDNLELRKAKRTTGVIKVIANAATIHASSTHLMANTEWDFMAVYHDAIDHFCHLAMKYHPPKRPEIPQEDYDNYNGVVEAGYRFHDMMLERTLELIDDDTTVIIMSDHGFHSDHQRPLYIPKEPSGPAIEHSPYGILVMAGPGIKSGGNLISGASVIDMTPTLLTLFGLPVGKDMEGRVITTAFSEPIEPEYIESWEKVDGDAGMHDPELKEDPWAAQEALKQLVELGYIEDIGDDKLLAVEKAKRESDYYVARNLINGGKTAKAIEMLERIFEESKILRYGQRLAFTYLATRKFSKCEKLIKVLREIEKENFAELKKRKLDKNPDDPFGNKEMEEPLYLEYVEGLLNLYINKPLKALPILEKVLKKNPNNVDVAINIGKIQIARKKFSAAAKSFIKALAVDDRNARAHHGLGQAFLRSGKLEMAVEELFLALEQNLFMPNAHYHLGEALYKSGYFKEAAEAFEVAVRLAPGMAKAHRYLVQLYTKDLNEPQKSLVHEQFLQQNIIGEIKIVTGLPMSGFYDVLDGLSKLENLSIYVNPKPATEEKKFLNPKVKELHLHSSWLNDMSGSVLYVPPQFLSFLPEKFNYKLLVAKRGLEDIIVDRADKKKSKYKKDTLPLGQLVKLQENESKIQLWIEAQPNAEVMFVDFDEFKIGKENILSQIDTFFTNS